MHREIRISTNAVPLCYVSIRKFECVIRPPLFRYPTVIISSPKSNRLILDAYYQLAHSIEKFIKFARWTCCQGNKKCEVPSYFCCLFFLFFFFHPLFFVDLGELMVRENIWRIILRRFIWRKFSRKDELENLFPANFDICSFNFFFIFFLEFQ